MNGFSKNVLSVVLISAILLATSTTTVRAQICNQESSGPVIVVFPSGSTAYAFSSYTPVPITSYFPPPEDSPSAQSIELPPGYVELPQLPRNTEGYFGVWVTSGSFKGFAKVYVPYTPADFRSRCPRLCVGDPVDFNNDGKVSLVDITLMLKAIKDFRSGTLSYGDLLKYDINHDGVVNNVDLLIVLEFACFGIHANGGTLPWMDITIGTYYDPNTHIHYVVGITDHFSLFGVH